MPGESGIASFVDCTFDSCGSLTISANSGDSTVLIRGCDFTNALAYPLYIASAGALTTGSRTISNCVFLGTAAADQMPYFAYQQGFTITGNYFDDAVTSAWEEPSWAEFSDNFIRRQAVQENPFGGDVTNNYIFMDTGSGGSAILVSDAQNFTISGNVFDTSNVSSYGYAIGFTEASNGPRPASSITGNILTAPSAGNPWTLVAATTNSAQANPLVVSITHNTAAVSGPGGAVVIGASGGNERVGSLSTIENNLFWATGTPTYSAVTNAGRDGDTSIGVVTDVVSAANVTNNAYSSLATVPPGTWSGVSGDTGVEDGTVYSTPMSGTTAPGANDVNLGTISNAQTQGPMFVDPTRNLESWDASLGGPGTVTHALAELEVANDSSNPAYDSRYTTAALIAWVRTGFAPTNPALKGAAADGTDIGAVPVAGSVGLPLPSPSRPSLAPASDSGRIGDGITNVRQPVLIGTATPGATVQILIGSTVLGSAPANSQGSYSVAFTSPLADGTYQVSAREIDAAGDVSALSPVFNLTILTRIPSTPTTPTLLPADDSGTPGDGVTNVPQPYLVGTAIAGDTVQIVDGSTVLGSAVAGSDGSYSVQVASPLADGTYSLQAEAIDVAGNVSALSQPFTLIESSASVNAVGTALVDTTTQGNWLGTFGSDGYAISQGPSGTNPSLPPTRRWASPARSDYPWAGSTTDPRALQTAAGPGKPGRGMLVFANELHHRHQSERRPGAPGGALRRGLGQ